MNRPLLWSSLSFAIHGINISLHTHFFVAVRDSSLKNMVMSFIQQTSQIIMTEIIFVSINDSVWFTCFQVMLFICSFFPKCIVPEKTLIQTLQYNSTFVNRSISWMERDLLKGLLQPIDTPWLLLLPEETTGALIYPNLPLRWAVLCFLSGI